MSRARRRDVRNAAAWLAAVFCIVALVAILSPSSSGQVNTGNPLIKQGQFPPDFELPRLNFSTDATGKPVGVISQQDTIRLSSFRGKKPVCLIMSSYT